jgi:hypothetical protein
MLFPDFSYFQYVKSKRTICCFFLIIQRKKPGLPSNGQAMIVGGVLVQLKSLIIKAER